MLKILKIKAGIDSSYDNIYFDGTQKELNVPGRYGGAEL